MNTIELRRPYLIFSGDEGRLTYAKTGAGLVQWCPQHCLGQLRLAGGVDLGLPDLSVDDAVRGGAGSLVIGTALVGGSVPTNWLAILCEGARAGLDIVAGLHTRLASIPELVDAAAQGGGRLVDVRVPPASIPVGTGRKRSGRRLLTVGTDCALGKKYTALQLQADLRAAGLAATFRATGQTGIMIAGAGIPLDAVVADFVSGAAEQLSPDNEPDHWDVIEGQGSIFHPGYGQVSHGLLIGSQPDAFVVCHAAGRIVVEGWEHVPLPSIGAVIQRTIDIGSLTNPDIRCVGISVNTSAVPSGERPEYLAALSSRYDLPCVDPLLTGTSAIVERLEEGHGF